jgi:hypothetical protein
MALIPKRALDAYARALESAAGAAGRQASRAVRSFVSANPEATVAQVRDFAIQAVTNATRKYGGATSALAAELFDEVAEAEGVPAQRAETWDGPDDDAISRGVRYQAGKLADGDLDGFIGGLSDLTGYHARAAANHTMAGNVVRTGGRLRYARVPRGAETCTFCMMLASRDFDYLTEESAGHANHRGCNCVIVPGIKGKTKVGGYDPSACRRLWRKFEAIDSEEGKSERAKNAAKKLEIFGERDKRIGALLRTYRADPTPDAWDALIGEYIRDNTTSGRVSAEPGADISAKELHCADLLGQNGHEISFRARVEGYRVKSPDLDIDGDEPWDIKTIQSENPNKVFQNIKRSNESGQAENYVIDLSLGTIEYDRGVEVARRALDNESLAVKRIIVIGDDGTETTLER